MSVDVRDLGLDLDAFEGPFDVLLTLVLKEELELADVDVAEIVLAFMEELEHRGALDLEASGEFLVLISSLLELKGRELFGEEVNDLEDLDPEELAEELAERLATYRRFKEAASWLRSRLADESDRYFRQGPAAFALPPSRSIAPQDPQRLAEAIRGLAKEPPEPSLRHLTLTFPPVSLFLERFRALIRRRRRFSFDEEVASLSRIEQAVAFLALLEMRKAGEVMIGQQAPFEPITAWSAHSV